MKVRKFAIWCMKRLPTDEGQEQTVVVGMWEVMHRLRGYTFGTQLAALFRKLVEPLGGEILLQVVDL